QRWPSPK
uniref:Bradykinin-potentiating peptide 7c n=1 Tax=Bothrops fonsecai TaxID=157549 RepID=BPP7C_BOTFO|nr:RecName: Full=Bradykinin-potentiating peptide 7c; Short=BPP-7c [Bothrops fonsecai]